MNNFDLKFMNGDILEITPETAQGLKGQTGLIWLNVLGGMINMSSVVSILPQGLVKNGRRKLHDGGYAIWKNGWVCEHAPDIKIDTKFYPELLKDKDEIKMIN